MTKVVITSQGIVAGGHDFGTTGAYEKLQGRIEFALDPADPHNRGITDLAFAPKGPDGRVHFSSDLHVLRPVNPAKGNGVLLFEVANRGNFGGASGLFGMLNGGDGADPDKPEYFGDALLLRDGYTMVWVGSKVGERRQQPRRRIDCGPPTVPSRGRLWNAA